MKRRKRRILLAALLALLAAFAVKHFFFTPRFGDGRVRMVVKETPLGPAPPEDAEFAFSPDMRHCVWVVERNDGQCLVHDGLEGPICDAINNGLLYCSTGWIDDDAWAYAARRAGKWFLNISGKEYGPYDLPYGGPTNSGSCWSVLPLDRFGLMRRFAWPMQRDGKWFLVSAGGEEGPYDEIFIPNDLLGLMVSGDLSQYDPEDEPDDEPTSKAAFSSDGRLVAYAASRDGKWFVVTNGKEGKGYDAIIPYTLEASANGLHACYAARDSRGEVAVFDGVEGPAYDKITWTAMTSDGKRFAYSARRGDRDSPARQEFAVVDGIEAGPYRSVWPPPSFTDDGLHCVYEASPDWWSSFPVIDGAAGRHDGIVASSLAIWHGHIAYLACTRDAKRSIDSVIPVVDGVPRTAVRSGSYYLRDIVAISSDGAGVAVRLGREREDALFLNGARVFVGDRIHSIIHPIMQPDFSPDAMHVSFITVSEHRALSGMLDWLESKTGIGLPYTGRNETYTMRVDGIAVAKSGSDIYPTFTQDSRHIVCVHGDDGKANLTIDGRRRPFPVKHDALLQWRLNDSVLNAAITRSGALILVEITFESE